MSQANPGNENIEIDIDSIQFHVNASVMIGISRLFAKKYVDLQTNHDKSFSLDFSDIKNKGPNLIKFFDLCKGRSPELELSDVFDLLAIAEEWEAGGIIKQLKLFLRDNVDSETLLSYFAAQVNAADFEVSSIFIDLIAEKCKEVYENKSFISLPPKYLCAILQSPYCAPPRRDKFDRFLVQVIKKNGIRCAQLIKYIDFLSTDYQNLLDLNEELKKNNIAPMFPNIQRILKLRQCEFQNEALQKKVADLETENKVLRERVNLLDSLMKNQK